jgi:hypothetical protein
VLLHLHPTPASMALGPSNLLQMQPVIGVLTSIVQRLGAPKRIFDSILSRHPLISSNREHVLSISVFIHFIVRHYFIYFLSIVFFSFLLIVSVFFSLFFFSL